MTLLELIGLLRRNARLVIALPVICAVVAAIYCWGFLPNQYTAEVSIYALTNSLNNQNETATNTDYSDLQSSQLLANDFVELAKNDQLKADVATKMKLPDLDDYDIDVDSSTTTRVIKVDVTGTDPQMTAQVANTFASQLGKTAKRVMGVEAVNIVNPAEVPQEPSGPSRALYTLVALIAGLFVAIVVVVIKDMTNTSIRSDEDLEELLALPVIGQFPKVREEK
jgi:capsular polysaccharide biosynthesis protein